MTDYHMILLYDVLKNFCIPASENAIDSGKAILTVGNYTVWEIDFDDLICCYFPDVDFLTKKNHFLNFTVRNSGDMYLIRTEQQGQVVTW